ncbi:tetratricopeptide repeat protein [Gluconobacter sp. OJB]|uniref:tetratricopeptide repeat protein n=1 Tax=Gluconobacter sp. OJB TaxID=3145196 RepID=UPI0031FA0FE5
MSVSLSSFQSCFVVHIKPVRVTSGELRDMLSRNLGDAARWIETAAKAGMAPAQIVWGQMLLEGRGVSRDAAAAFGWFVKAANGGDIEAKNMVGRCYEQGWGIAPNARRATEYFADAAYAGHLWGQVNLAQMLMRSGKAADHQRCFELFKKVAEQGTGKARLKAMNSLARFLEEGWAGKTDPKQAAFWYLKAANLGDHWAQYNLATILLACGEQQEAERWLASAVAISDNGFRRRIAPLLLGRTELSVRQHGLNALAFCAESGAIEDLWAYGLALDNGVAGTSDTKAGMRFIRQAASLGHAQAKVHVRHRDGYCTLNRLSDALGTFSRKMSHLILLKATL